MLFRSGAAGIYRNNGAAPRVAVRLQGSGRNTRGIGARIRLVPAAGNRFVTQSQECVAGGRYLGSDDPARTFAAPDAAGGWQLEVTWRPGAVTTLANVQPGRIYEVAEQASTKPGPLSSGPPTPWFSDVSGLLNHRHVDAPFNDRERQPLLPRLLSNLGPGVTWADVDNDGRDELLVGAGRGGTLAVFRNGSTAGKPAFQLLTNAALARPLGRDLTSIQMNSGVVIAGSANYEDGNTNAGLVRTCIAGV